MAPPWPRAIMIIASMDKPSPNATTDKITASGPKKTKAYVATASANHALGFTIIQNRLLFPYKTFESNCT
jgi:hypothetical protein